MARTGCRFASEDEYLDAVQDAAYDQFLQDAVTCAECGTLYDQGYHPSTRFEPAWIEREECPNCGSPTLEGNSTGVSGGG